MPHRTANVTVSDVVVVGAGIVGAACAYAMTRVGLRVTVVDRGAVAGGTTGAGEGNLLVSDKPPGPELELMLLSLRCWREIGADLGDETIELDPKGGLVVAETEQGHADLRALAGRQRRAGVTAETVTVEHLPHHEPYLARDLAGGVHYPQDTQVQPMLAAARLLEAARDRGAHVRTDAEVTGLRRARHQDRVTAVETTAGPIPTGVVVNAAGTWGGELSQRLGVPIPILPRRGFVLVTEPLPRLIRHKVYAAEYVANVASDAAGLETSAVVEGTAAGTVLIGASRERVGFDRTFSVPVLARLAQQAIRLFPVLADMAVIRAYRGFRPYSPDHLPVIGADPRVEGVLHACGHEGAGVGLAAATGHLLARHVVGERPELDLAPFSPGRFLDGAEQ